LRRRCCPAYPDVKGPCTAAAVKFELALAGMWSRLLITTAGVGLVFHLAIVGPDVDVPTLSTATPLGPEPPALTGLSAIAGYRMMTLYLRRSR